MKLPKKKVRSKPLKASLAKGGKSDSKSLLSKIKRGRGIVDAGTVYGVILLGIIIAGGLMMLGDTTPGLESRGQTPVIPKTGDFTQKSSRLQLEDFAGATLTPSPTPTPTPSPTPTSMPPSSGGGGGDTSCFAKGTKILMADRTEKNIEDVHVGDKVMGYDKGKQVPQTVLELESPVRDHLYELQFADGTKLLLTREHPLFTKTGWKSLSPESTAKENPRLKVGMMKLGDAVLNSQGDYIKITDINFIPGKVQTYNLKSVSGSNNYYAGDKLAHNKGDGGTGGTQL